MEYNNLDFVNLYLTDACKFEFVTYLIMKDKEGLLKINNEDDIITEIGLFFLKDSFVNTMTIHSKCVDKFKDPHTINIMSIIECNKSFNNAYKTKEESKTHI